MIVDWMLASKIERNDIVVALGGGVVGDLVGFAAAILRRGIDTFSFQLHFWHK